VTVRVCIADDQALVRAGFRMILESEPDLRVVGDAADGRQAVDLATAARPDVFLMDIQMPELDGIEAARRIIAQAGPDGTRVVMLTTFDIDEHVYDALRAGASGFLLKDVAPDDLVAAVRVVAAGDALLAPSVTRRMLAHFTAGRRAVAPPELAELTPREHEVLQLIARGLSNQEIGDALFVTETTVKTHVTRILGKLGLRDRVQAVVFAYESGVVRPGGEDDPTETVAPPR
jgi:DNA-binding NarL/FixJ family response regulator